MSNRAQGCPEYQSLSRRGFLALSAKATALASLGPAWLPTVKFAPQDDRLGALGSSRDILVSIYLRGGCDGLTMCVPFGDPHYYAARPALAVPPPDSGQALRAINLDGFFGLPPALAPLKQAYDQGDLLIVHATGSHDETRSHFDAQHYMEAGKVDNRLWTGWLGRHLATSDPATPNPFVRGVSLTPTMPLTLDGGPQSLPLNTLQDYEIGGDAWTLAQRRQYLSAVYQQADARLSAAAQNVMATVDMLENLNFASYAPMGGAEYGEHDFGWAMRASAALIRYDVGIEALHVDMGGWDTHAWQGSVEGQMATLMTHLAQGLAAFHTDMTAAGRFQRITVVVLSEFGRVVTENGSLGTDHGHGNCLFLMGGAVNGGQVMRIWPGLAVEHRFQGQDLEVTIDYRDIVAEVVQKRLNNSNLATVFPEFSPTFRNAVQP